MLFEQAAVQGQTIVSAAGDNGAQDCDTGGANPSARLAVDDPAGQPDVVGVGGTSLAAGAPPTETVWNGGVGGPGAGGGGVSAPWPMGSDQLDAPGFLHVRTAAANGTACRLPRNRYCREVPDVSADADPATGYEIYWNGADPCPSRPAGRRSAARARPRRCGRRCSRSPTRRPPAPPRRWASPARRSWVLKLVNIRRTIVTIFS